MFRGLLFGSFVRRLVVLSAGRRDATWTCFKIIIPQLWGGHETNDTLLLSIFITISRIGRSGSITVSEQSIHFGTSAGHTFGPFGGNLFTLVIMMLRDGGMCGVNVAQDGGCELHRVIHGGGIWGGKKIMHRSCYGSVLNSLTEAVNHVAKVGR